MKKKLLTVVGLSAFAIFALALGTEFLVSAQDADKTESVPEESFTQLGGGRLAGTWNVLLTARNCETGEPLATIRELQTFNQGGTLIASTSRVPPGFRFSPGHGVWSHETENTYKFRLKLFRFDSAGVFVGSIIAHQTITLNNKASEYESSGGITFLDTNDNPVPVPPPGCSTTTATRLE
jgi:hypothetical protein